MDKLLRMLVKSKRNNLPKNIRTRTRRFHKPKPMIYPLSVERSYQLFLKNKLGGFFTYVKGLFKQNMQGILRGDSLDNHLDALPGQEWKKLMATMKKALNTFMPDLETAAPGTQLTFDFEDQAQAITTFNLAQWNKQMESMLGFTFDTNAPWWPDMKKAWAERNYELIKSIATQYIGQVNDIVEKAVVNGGSYLDVMDGIDSMGLKLSESKTRLIARDQVGKLNGRISQGRQGDVGINSYVWMTAQDERVRGDPGGKYPNADPSHYAMEGLVCSWDDPTIYSDDGGKTWQKKENNMPMMHPGEDYQCRCTSAPNWLPLLNSLDAEIDGNIEE